MNCIYRLVWNRALNALVAVSENAKGRGKSGSARKCIVGALALFSPMVLAAPTEGQISAGSGAIAQSGANTTITQQSQNLAINWQSFGVATNEAVRFNQPNASAIALNRVLGQTSSQILGNLSANGQVFILNPNGVLFGNSAQVSVGGLVASTLSLGDADFMSGKHTFSGTTGAVINQGSLTASQGGYIALLAPEVRNEGVISATLGTALLAAGDKVTLNLNNGSLLSYSIDQGSLNALADNKQLIQADGGQVFMSAKAADTLSKAVVNNTGIIEARTIKNVNGIIRLEGGAQGITTVSGTLDASGLNAGEAGGTVKVLGDRVALLNGARINVSGDAGGGIALIGGNYQGNGPEQNAIATFIAQGAQINADAVTSGNGGKLIAWSNDATRVYGSLSAKGGAQFGNGGFIETSGKKYLEITQAAVASAANGTGGTWLLDPNDIIIQATGVDTNISVSPNFTSTNDTAIVTTTSIQTALNAGTSVVVATGAGGTNAQLGDITITGAIIGGANANTTQSLTLNASHDIIVGAAIAGGGNGATRLNVVFNATSGAVNLNAGADLSTKIGNVTINSATLNQVAGITIAGTSLTVNNSGSGAMAGVIGGATALTKQGAGSLTLSGANTYTGLTTISAGTLMLGSTSALGTAAAGTSITAGATLDLNGFTLATAEPLTLRGTGVGTTTGALTNSSATAATYSGLITLGSASSIAANNGSIVLSNTGTITGATFGLTLGGTNTASSLSSKIGTTTGTLTKNGTGTWTLSGGSTFTGLTTVNAGTLTEGIANALSTGALTVNGGTFNLGAFSDSVGAVTLTGGSITGTTGVLTGTSYAMQSGSVSAILGGTGALTKSTAGIVTLSGANTYTGLTTISAGTLMLGSTSALGTAAAGTSITAGATLDLNGFTLATAEPLTLRGTGVGTTTGALTNSSATAATYSGLITLGSASSIAANNGSIVLSNTGTITGATFGLTLGGTNTASSLSSKIGTTTGTLTKNGTGTWTLSGGSTFTGLTTVNAGTLTEGIANALSTGALTVNGGTFNLGAFSDSVGAVTLTGGSITGTTGVLTGTSYAMQSGSVSAILGGTGALTKSTAGIVTLSGANTYTGLTTISAGTLMLGSTSALGTAAAGTSITAGATLDLNGFTLATAEPLTLNGTGVGAAGALINSSATAASYSGAITLGSASSIAANNGNMTLSGAISGAFGLTLGGTNTASSLSGVIGTGAGTLTKNGSGTWTLSGANTYTGLTTISAGTLMLGSTSALGTAAAGTSITAGATLDLNGFTLATAEPLTLRGTGVGTTTGALTNSSATAATYSGLITLGSASSIAANNGSIVLSNTGTITGATFGLTLGGTNTASSLSSKIGTTTGTLTKNGTGTWTLSGGSTFTGLTTVNAGTLTEGIANALSTGALTVNGGTFNLGAFSDSVGAVTLTGGSITGTTGVLTGTSYAMQSGSVSAILGGTGALTKSTAGIVTLSGANTYTGLTTISAGTLMLGSTSALGTAAAGTSITAGATLDLNGFTLATAEPLTLNGTGVGAAGALINSSATAASYSGAITLGSASSIAANNGNMTLSGAISGAFGLTLGGTNTASSLSGVIGTGAGTLTKNGSGTWTLSGANTYTGLTTISAGTLMLGSTSALGTAAAGTSITAGATLDLNGFTLATAEPLTLRGTGVGTTTGALTNSSATAATYSGLITLGSASSIAANNGSIVLSNTGTITGATFGLTLGGTNTASSLSSKIGTTTGTLTKNGTGTWTLSGGSTFTGLTTVNAGTLTEGIANALSTGALTVNGGTFNLGAFSDSVGAVTLTGGSITGTTGVLTGTSYAMQSGSVSAILGGTGALTKSTAGTVTLSGANTYTGLTTVNAGTLAVTNNAGLGATASGTTVASGATLDLQGVTVGAEAVTLTGGTLASNSGASSLAGTVTLGADSNLNIGGVSLTLGGAIDGAWALNITGNGAAILSAAVGNNTALGSLTSAAETTLFINGGMVRASGGQTYNGATTFGAPTTLRTTVGGDISAPGTVAATSGMLTLDAGAGNVTLSNAGNNFSTVTVSSGNTVSLIDMNALTIAGISATGLIDVRTQSGDLTLTTAAIATASASANAVTLVADATSTPDVAGSGGNFNNAGNVAITTGSGGTWRIYTGNPTGTNRGGLAEAGKRYNVDFGSAPIASGNRLYFRNQPTLTLAADNKSKTYADVNPTFTYTGSGMVDGDLISAALSSGPSYRIDGSISTVGELTAGTLHTITPDSAIASSLGYSLSYATGVLTVNPRHLTITALGGSRIYDGSTNATVTLGDSRISGDVLTGTYAAASFADKNVATGKAVNVSGIAVTGADAGNYTFNTSATTAADITARALAVSATGANKVYDGSTNAAVTYGDDRVAGDVLSFNGTASFADKNAATGKTVNVSGIAVTGADAGNYTFNTSATTAADITARALAVSATGANKVYDGSTNAAVTYGDDRVAGDVLSFNGTASFADKNAATGKTVNVSGIAVTGADAGNYTFNTSATTAADITARALAVSATGANKVYDGSTNAAVTYGDDRVAGDVLSFNGTASFADKNAATGKTVNVSGIAVTGADAGNYTFNTSATTAADITARAITVSGITANTKVYDSTTSATLNLGAVNFGGIISGDTIGITTGSISGSFTDKNVGINKAVNLFGVSLSGADADNYTLSGIAGVAGTITKLNLAVGGITAQNKVYDANTSATLAGTATIAALAGDNINIGGIGNGVFANKDVGENKIVTVSGYTVSGADAGNYNLMQPVGVAASITPVPAGGIMPAVAQAITALPGGSNLISAFSSAVSIVATSVVNPVILLLNTPTSLSPAATPAIQTGGSKAADNKAAVDNKELTPVQARNEVQVGSSRVEQRGGFTILGSGMKLPGDI
jgi:filamentous hemagglutinin family protein